MLSGDNFSSLATTAGKNVAKVGEIARRTSSTMCSLVTAKRGLPVF